jgi:putative ABC transport system permease protein
MLAKSPLFTVVALLTLALGIGANGLVFSVVNGVLLRSLPFQDADQLVMLWETEPQLSKAPVLSQDFLEWKEQNHVFQNMGAYNEDDFTLTGSGNSEQIKGGRVSSELFPLLSVQPERGRLFTKEEDLPGSNHLAIISYGLWQSRFGFDPNIIGRQLLLNGEAHNIIGVLRRDFHFVEQADLWVPLALTRQNSDRKIHYLKVFARLKPGVTVVQAQAEMNTVASRLQEQYAETNKDVGVKVVSLQEQFVGNIRLQLLILLGVVGFVLLIACANVANLLLARATGRQKEIAIRLALGATRLRIVRQVLTESVLLALMGGVVGLLIAFLGKDLVLAGLDSTFYLQKISLDLRVLGFMLAISILTGIIFGLTPALQVSRPNLNETLKEGGKGSGFHRNRLSNLLVILEMALALILLIGSGLLINSFLHLQKVNPGFNPDGVLTLQISLPESKYSTGPQQAAFYQQVLQRIKSLPGVRYAGAISHLPLSGSNVNGVFTIEGHLPWAAGQEPLTEFRLITPEYFSAMETPLLQGRLFTDADNDQSTGVVIINETMARRFWPGVDPLGKRVKIGGANDPFPYMAVVGVVGNVKHFGLNSEARPEMYIPYPQFPLPALSLVVRTASDPTGLGAAVRAEVQAVDKDQPVYNVRTMKSLLAGSLAQPRLYMTLLSIFAAIAVLLAAIGIYGIMAYSVNQRRHEIAIRMALGAQANSVLKLIVGQGMTLALLGMAMGLVGAFVLTRVLSSLLYGISATDLPTFAGVFLALGMVALLASYLPARKATKVDPVVALRNQ